MGTYVARFAMPFPSLFLTVPCITILSNIFLLPFHILLAIMNIQNVARSIFIHFAGKIIAQDSNTWHCKEK